MITIEQILNSLNITSNYKGYKIIITAVEIALEDELALDNVIERIYHRVAEINGISFVSVERNIRTAISHSWAVVPFKFDKVLNYKCDKSPNASLFIRLMAEKIKSENNL